MLLIAFSCFVCLLLWKLFINLHSAGTILQDLRLKNYELIQKFIENERVNSSTKQFKYQYTNICFHKYIKSRRSLPDNIYRQEHNNNGQFDLNNNVTSSIRTINQNQNESEELDIKSRKNRTSISLVNQKSNKSQQSDSMVNNDRHFTSEGNNLSPLLFNSTEMSVSTISSQCFDINPTDLYSVSAAVETASGPHMKRINWDSTLNQKNESPSENFGRKKHFHLAWRKFLKIFGECFGIRKK